MLTATRLITCTLICFVHGVTAPYIASSVPRAKYMQTRTVERRVHLNPVSVNDSHYVYVPFQVPPHTSRISISYDYPRANGANTIDIGLFDARSTGSDSDQRGFRGWSGGRRSEFFISADQATAGYLPGEMPSGTWRIILGLYRLAPAGVDVSFRIGIETKGSNSSVPDAASHPTELSSANAAASASAGKSDSRPTSSLAQRVAGRGLRWWSGDLHMHTVHSDGDWTIAEVTASARTAGLDFIAITDHNTASHHAEIDRLSKGSTQPLVLRGEEITTYGGHTNAWGLPSGKWIDFRVHPGDSARISNIVAQAHVAGALISINHPFALCGGCAWSYNAAAHAFDAIEVWNGPWDPTDEQALVMWDKMLQSGQHITAVASSDSHRPINPIGHPATHVAARELSQKALLDAIRKGHVYLTDDAARTVVNLEAEVTTGKRPSRWMIGDEVQLAVPTTLRFFITSQAGMSDTTVSFISNGQVIRSFPAKADGQVEVIDVECKQGSYFRIEVRDKTKAALALTNPIYVKVGKHR